MEKNRKQIFLREVTEQIKSKEAKQFVVDELTYHIKQSKQSWIDRGLTESEAEAKAIESMGSPTKLGIEMNKLHRPKMDWWTLILLGVILLLGFLPLLALGQNGYMATTIFLKNKVIIVLLGALLAVGIMFFDYRRSQTKGWLFYGLGILLLLAIKFISNRIIGGVPRIEIGPLTIESLMAIPLFLLAWASFFNQTRLKVWSFIGLFLIPIYLFLSIPSLPNVYIYTIMVFAMLFWSKFGKKTATILLSSAIGLGILFGVISWNYLKEYQKLRLLGFLSPEDHAMTSGNIYIRLKEFLANAGWFGFEGEAKFLPEAHTDYVFVTFTYYYGWLLAAALVVILSLLAVRMMFVALKIKDTFGKLLLIGVVGLYVGQLATNVAMSIGLVPIIAVSLPFMSYGLMPTVLNAVLIGIVLSIYRRKDMAVLQG
ncbi:FtsW/RodA/SpoVE family cell cycle protein [Pseudoneobacillus sp. C159]